MSVDFKSTGSSNKNMNHTERVVAHIDEHVRLVSEIPTTHWGSLQIASSQICKSLLNGGCLFWCGNGGSAADSQHLAAELIGRFKNSRRPLRSIALTADTSVLTCIANDFCFDTIFERQIEALGREGDILLALTTSGNSANVIRALKMSNKLGLSTIALLGKDGGEAISLADLPILISSDSTACIQEVHITIGHLLCDLIEHELGLS